MSDRDLLEELGRQVAELRAHVRWLTIATAALAGSMGIVGLAG